MKNCIIIGSGKAGRLLLGDISLHHPDIRVIGVLDDNASSKNLGPINNLKTILTTYKVDEIILAIPSASGSLIRSILLQCPETNSLSIRILPRNFEIVMKSSICLNDTRYLVPEDIVGEHIDKDNQLRAYKELKGKSILITGAGGSIGSELAKQVALASPQTLVLIDFSEYNLFRLKRDIAAGNQMKGKMKIHFVLGDINNKHLMKELFMRHAFHSVFHAAAYKHLPLLEDNLYEASHNNIVGTFTIASLAAEFKVKKCILISTDKAVLPTCVMGKTKKIAEMIMDHFSFTSVRFGNVFNSSGSAVEIFLRQIREAKPVTITNGEMNRFFMTVHEAVHLVLQAWLMNAKKSLYMLEMGAPVSIVEIAKCLAIVEGRKPTDVKLTIIGKHASEKINEVLIDPHSEQKKKTSHKRIASIQHSPQKLSDRDFEDIIAQIERAEVMNHSPAGEKKLREHLERFIS